MTRGSSAQNRFYPKNAPSSLRYCSESPAVAATAVFEVTGDEKTCSNTHEHSHDLKSREYYAPERKGRHAVRHDGPLGLLIS